MRAGDGHSEYVYLNRSYIIIILTHNKQVTPGLGILAVLLILTIKEPARGQSDDPRNKKGVKGEIGVRGYYNDIKYLMKKYSSCFF